MEIYRIAKAEHQNIDGTGGLLYPGRWHEKGNRVVYTSQYRSLAAFEALVHLSKPFILQSNFVLITIFIPDDALQTELPEHVLKPGWDNFNNKQELQKVGTQFLKDNKFLLLKVPSVIIKKEYNYILNPQHSGIRGCNILDIEPFLFDNRLI